MMKKNIPTVLLSIYRSSVQSKYLPYRLPAIETNRSIHTIQSETLFVCDISDALLYIEYGK